MRGRSSQPPVSHEAPVQPGGAVPASSAADRQRWRDRARRRDRSPVRTGLPRRRRCLRPGRGVPRAVAVRRTHHPGPPRPLLPHPGSGGRREFRSHLGVDRRWRGEPETRDAWGRSLWPRHRRGTRSHRGDPRTGPGPLRHERNGRLPHPHAMAFAALGAAEILGPMAWSFRRAVAAGHRRHRHRRAGRRRGVAVAVLPGSATRTRPIAEAVIVAGENVGASISATACACSAAAGRPDPPRPPVRGPGRGLGRGEDVLRPDPSQAAALADACTRAAAVTGETTWLTGVEMSVTLAARRQRRPDSDAR